MARAVFRIENRLGVQVPAKVVWRVLSDLEKWGEWCPIYPEVSGEIAYGTRLTVTERLPGLEPQVITPTVLDWEPDAQIIWRLSQSWGFLKRIRYFEIDVLSDEGCIFSNGEDWYGRPARYVSPARRRAMREGYEAMGEALKARALAVWQAEGGAPTSASE
jgi:hypothetical protein